jgi:hypothetical protein
VEVYLPRFCRPVVPAVAAREIDGEGVAASAEGFRLWRRAALGQFEDPRGG